MDSVRFCKESRLKYSNYCRRSLMGAALYRWKCRNSQNPELHLQDGRYEINEELLQSGLGDTWHAREQNKGPNFVDFSHSAKVYIMWYSASLQHSKRISGVLQHPWPKWEGKSIFVNGVWHRKPKNHSFKTFHVLSEHHCKRVMSFSGNLISQEFPVHRCLINGRLASPLLRSPLMVCRMHQSYVIGWEYTRPGLIRGEHNEVTEHQWLLLNSRLWGMTGLRNAVSETHLEARMCWRARGESGRDSKLIKYTKST